MDAVARDAILYEIEQQLKEKDRILVNKESEMVTSSSENEYLKQVLADYQRYRAFMIQQKQTQLDALQKILNHTETLKKTGEKVKKINGTLDYETINLKKKIADVCADMDQLMLEDKSQIKNRNRREQSSNYELKENKQERELEKRERERKRELEKKERERKRELEGEMKRERKK